MHPGSGPAQLWMALRYGSTIPTRLALVIGSELYAIAVFNRPPPGGAPWQWSMVFAVIGLLILWRIIDRRVCIGLTRFVNACTCALYIGYCAATISVVGLLTPGIAGQAVFALASIWVVLRTDLTQSDRESA